MSRKNRLIELFKNHFPGAVHLEVIDESHKHSRGQETHYKCIVVAPQFKGLSRVQRHRKVMSLAEAELQTGLHSLSLRLLDPEQASEESLSFQSPNCFGGSQ